MLPETLRQCIEWYVSVSGQSAPDASQYCQTRDVLDGRLARLLAYAGSVGLPEGDAALLGTTHWPAEQDYGMLTLVGWRRT